MSKIVKKAPQIKIGVSLKELVTALEEMSQDDREFFIENVLAATSPEYLKSIKETRLDYKKGKVYSHEEVFK